MLDFIIFIVGLIFGSFLNVVIYRLNQKKSFLAGRSFCPNCHKMINWYDNIPLLSFFLLFGRCRFCQKKISWQYPLVELLTGLIFLWLFWQFGLSLKFLINLVFAGFLLVIFVYDLKYYLILDQITVPAIVFAFLANLYLGLGFWSLFFGAVLGGSFFALQFFVSGGKWVGDGDIRLGILMGLMLGWQFLLVALFLAYLFGAIVGLILIFLKKKEISSKIPFAPFLTFATLITLAYGQDLLSWYLNLIYF